MTDRDASEEFEDRSQPPWGHKDLSRNVQVTSDIAHFATYIDQGNWTHARIDVSDLLTICAKLTSNTIHNSNNMDMA